MLRRVGPPPLPEGYIAAPRGTRAPCYTPAAHDRPFRPAPTKLNHREGRRLAGMEHWLPLFEDRLETLFDHLGAKDLIVIDSAALSAAC